jgi:hypothetical protein
MSRIGRAAMTAAVLTSVMSVADAVHHGLTGHYLLDDERAARWVIVGSNLLIAATFALLAAVLAERAPTIDAGSRAIRWLRRLTLGDLALLALVFGGGIAIDPRGDGAITDIWGALGGLGFLLMFVLGTALGLALLRRREMRLPAALMAAPLALVPLTILVNAVAADWAHPAYAESALYIGLAMLAGVTSGPAGGADRGARRAGAERVSADERP